MEAFAALRQLIRDGQEGHQMSVNSVAFSRQSDLMVSASEDKTMKVWGVPSFSLVSTIAGHSQAVCSVAFSPQSDILVSGDADGVVIVWRVPDFSMLTRLTDHNKMVVSLTFSMQGDFLATAGRDKHAIVRSVPSFALYKKLEPRYDEAYGITSVIFSPTGKHVVTVEFQVAFYRTWPELEYLITIRGHTQCNSVAFSPDGHYIVTVGMDPELSVWRTPQVVDGGKSPELFNIKNLNAHGSDVLSASFSPEGSMLITSGLQTSALVWSVPGFDLLRKCDSGSDIISAVAFARNSKFVAMACCTLEDKYEQAEMLRRLSTLQLHAEDIFLDEKIKLWCEAKRAAGIEMTHKQCLENLDPLFNPGGDDGVKKLHDEVYQMDGGKLQKDVLLKADYLVNIFRSCWFEIDPEDLLNELSLMKADEAGFVEELQFVQVCSCIARRSKMLPSPWQTRCMRFGFLLQSLKQRFGLLETRGAIVVYDMEKLSLKKKVKTLGFMDMGMPWVSLVILLLQMMSFGFSHRYPWNHSAVKRIRDMQKISMLDFEGSHLLVMTAKIAALWLLAVEVVHIAFRGYLVTSCFWSKVTEFKLRRYIGVVAAALFVPTLTLFLQVTTCSWVEEEYNPWLQKKFGRKLECYSGVHLVLVCFISCVVPFFLWAQVLFSMVSGDITLMSSEDMWRPSSWSDLVDQRHQRQDMGFFKPTTLRHPMFNLSPAAAGAISEIVLKVAVPLASAISVTRKFELWCLVCLVAVLQRLVVQLIMPLYEHSAANIAIMCSQVCMLWTYLVGFFLIMRFGVSNGSDVGYPLWPTLVFYVGLIGIVVTAVSMMLSAAMSEVTRSTYIEQPSDGTSPLLGMQ